MAAKTAASVTTTNSKITASSRFSFCPDVSELIGMLLSAGYWVVTYKCSWGLRAAGAIQRQRFDSKRQGSSPSGHELCREYHLGSEARLGGAQKGSPPVQDHDARLDCEKAGQVVTSASHRSPTTCVHGALASGPAALGRPLVNWLPTLKKELKLHRSFRSTTALRRGGTLSLAAVALGVIALIVTTFARSGTLPVRAEDRTALLNPEKFFVKSLVQVDLQHDVARFPLHKGTFQGRTYWFIITEASDFGLARDLNVNFAPKLANLAIGCPQCVQTVTLKTSADNKFGDAIVNFQGVVDFSPTRKLVAGPTGFPPTAAEPGAVGDANYSPFIRIQGSDVVYNAPIVASGDGPFDVDTHTNTGDRVLAVQIAAPAPPGQFRQSTADLLFVTGFAAGQKIIYTSTDASIPLAATIERATFVPRLQDAPFLGGDDTLGSARERIFIFANGQTGADNKQAQGLAHVILDGHAAEDASLKNTGLIEALRNEGDALNVLGDVPSLADPRHANAYSPLWDAQLGQWTKKAVDQGLNKRQTDENQILNLAAERPDLLTGPGGAPYGSVGFVINCPILAFINTLPSHDLVPLAAGAQG